MIKVLLADDHYPVLEFLHQSIPWSDLEIEIIGLCSDGLEALEHSERDMPDILITDIGMPKLDGLKLIQSLKEKNSHLQTIILSCHDEFQYAQEAVKLEVSAYVLKESMQPEEITELLRKVVDKIRGQHHVKQRNDDMQRILDQNQTLLRSEFIRRTLNNPILNEQSWITELKGMGVDIEAEPYMAVLLYPNDASSLQRRFQTDGLMNYAFDNVIEEMIDSPKVGVSFRYGAQEMFVLFPFPRTIKRNQYDIVRGHLASLLAAFRCLEVRMSAALSEPSSTPEELRKQLRELMVGGNQRFYAPEGSIYKRTPFMTSTEDVFVRYQQALDDFKQLIALERAENCKLVVNEWMQYIRDGRYPVERVRGFVLKLLMDIEVKYNSLQHFHGTDPVEALHKTMMQLYSLSEIERFVDNFLRCKIELKSELRLQSQRPVIFEAQKYVSTHLREKIKLEEAASYLNMNSSHFSRIYKNETGETFIEYVIRIKMEQAKEVLEQSGLTTQQVAESLGYDNTSYFIKLFRLYTGYSPKEYRFSR